MKKLALFAPALLLGLPACQPKGDATKANEAVARHGDQRADVSTLPPDESTATPSNQLAAGDQAAGNQ